MGKKQQMKNIIAKVREVNTPDKRSFEEAELGKKQIIKPNENCDAEYFFCSWFDINSIPKHNMILPGHDICELMEEYHRQKSAALFELTEIKFPSELEILLQSSDKIIYVNDDQRIGYQKGAKWIINWIKQNNNLTIKEDENNKNLS